MESPVPPTIRAHPKIKIHTAGPETLPTQSDTLSPSTPSLPSFPGLKRNSIRNSSLFIKTSKSIDSPKTPLKSPASTLGLFPVEMDRRSSPGIGHIGVPLAVPMQQRNSVFMRSPVHRNSRRSFMKKDMLGIEPGQFKRTSIRKTSSSEINTKKAITVNPVSQKAAVLRRLKTGHINVNAIDESMLVQLALDALKKTPDHRSSKEIDVLVKCMGHLEFFKEHNKRTVENLMRVMRCASMKTGETVYKVDDPASSYWIILRGAVNIFEYIVKVNPESRKGATEKEFDQLRMASAVSEFGEIEMSKKALRTWTVVCSEDCEFGFLEKDDFKRVMMERTTREGSEKAEFFASIPLFKGWTTRNIKDLCYDIPGIVYKRGNVIYNQDEEAEKMYIVRRGEFKKMKEIEIGGDRYSDRDLNRFKKEERMKKVVDVCLIGEKEVFGEVELLNSEKRRFKIVCESLEAEVFEISKKDLQNRILVHKQTKDWLEEHAKAKQKRFDERLQAVREATRKHKHLLVFTKPLSIPTSPTSVNTISMSRPLSIAQSPFANEIIQSQLIELGSPVSSMNFEKGFGRVQTLPNEETEALSIREARKEIKSQFGQRSKLSTMMSVQSLAVSPRGEGTTPRTREPFQKIMSPTKPHSSRGNYYTPRNLKVSSPRGEEISGGRLWAEATGRPWTEATERTERAFNKKASTANLIEEKNMTPKHRSEKSVTFTKKNTEKNVANNVNAKANEEKPENRKQTSKTPRGEKERVKSFEGHLKLAGLDDAQSLMLLTKSSAFSYLYTNDETGDETKTHREKDFRTSLEGFGPLFYNKTIEKATSKRQEIGKATTLRMRDTEEAKSHDFRRINWGMQKQKVRNMIEAKGGKEYRRFFLSLEKPDITMTTREIASTRLTIDGMRDKEGSNTKVELGKQKKTVKLEKKLSEIAKSEPKKRVGSLFDLNGK